MEQTGYLDFHTHILPGIDDGPMDMEATKAILQMAYQQGIRTILATPHNYPEGCPQDNEKVRALCNQVNEEARNIDNGFCVLAGNEILYRDSIAAEIQEGHVLTLADSRYLLIEFLPSELYCHINEGMRQLILEGFYPVIAHVEDVSCLMENPERIRELVELGCYIQANCENLLGSRFDRRASTLRRLMEENLIHFLGSGYYEGKGTPPIMATCIRQLYKKIAKKTLDKVIYDNPNRFLQKRYL